ncbi:MAG: efflux RND transporter permease subunit [Planctomycetaceae bacterium]|nr:efflux RND transporter permease subunit [Planctomycetaceae bacterium]
MRWFISTALQFRVLVASLAVLLIVMGIRTADNVPLDVFPEFAPPVVEIQTEVPGISTEEVESLVTVPIENALNGIPFVTTVRSKSVLGLSSVRMYFNQGTDLLTARQLVQERLTLVAQRLPAVTRPPVILPPLSSLSRAMKIGLSSETVSQMDMTVLSKWTIRPRLMAVPGVANVAIWGEKDRQFQVLVDPDRLRAHNVTLDQVTLAAREAVTVGAGGFVDTPNQRLAVRHASPVYGPEDLAETVVTFQNGAPLQLGDVADVVIGHPPEIGDAVINAGLGIMLIVEKQPWANTLDVTRGVEAAMKDLQPGLGDIQVDTTIFRPATFIERSIENLTHAMWLGCVLVVVVLVLFLYDWRAALISATAIPLSLLATVLVLSWRGGTVNTMVLAGLVIALGEVVDDAIIDVENIVRRLRQNRELGHPVSAFRVVLDASMEVRSAVVYASLIVILAFLPVFFLDGLAGSFFRPLAASYVLAILASLGVALTVTPALSLMLLPRAGTRRRESPVVSLLQRPYRWLLPGMVKRPVPVLLLGLVVLVGAGVSVPFLGDELLPKFKETDFLMHWVEKPGIGIDAMNRITIRASDELRAIPGVRNFGAHIGRAEVADEVVGPNFTELWISIDEKADYDSTVAQVQEVVDGYPGLYRDLLTYLTERIKEVLTGTSASIVVRIYGPNLEQLRETAQEVAAEIKGVNGVAALKVEPQVLVPQVVVRLRADAAARFGLTPGQIQRAATTITNGIQVGEIYEDQKIFRVTVWGTERVRSDLDALRNLLIDTPSGAQVPLEDVADLSIEPTPNTIKREGASRRIDVSCNVAGRDLGSVAREIEERVRANVAFDSGYHPEFLGEYAEAQASRRRFLALCGLSLLGILVLLHADFQSIPLVLLIFLTLPLALTGGVAGAFLGGGVISLGSLVGFVTVLGIAVRNGIMLVSHYCHLEHEEGMPFGPELVLRGAEERLAPIVMTALTTALALLPLVAGGNQPGQEIEYPMAWVILGGLVTATALNLFVVPVLYLRVGRNGRSGRS